MKTVNILDVAINNISTQELLKSLTRKGGVVVTPNVDHLMKLRKDAELRKVYQQSDYRICDSKIIQFASRFLGTPIHEKISGSDLFPAFYKHHKDNDNITIFLLGAKEGVAKIAQENINQTVGRNMIVDCYSPKFGFEKDEDECQSILEKIKASGATVVAVGLGAPKQEKWINRYKKELPGVKIFLAIGATIDFEAGYKSRSPKWMSELGLEWLYRLLSEPKRLWKRYLIESMPFFALIFRQKIKMVISSKPFFSGQLLKMTKIFNS